MGAMHLKEEWTESLAGLDKKQALKAAVALLKYIEKKNSEREKQLLFENESSAVVFMDVGLKKVPDLRWTVKPYQLPVPHMPYSADPEVCVIVKDGEKGEVKQKFEDMLVPEVAQKVISTHDLETEYESFAARRHLAQSYELFVSRNTARRGLSKLLGKEFWGKRRFPVEVRAATKEDWSRKIESAKRSALWFNKHSNYSSICIGTTLMKPKQLVENIFSALHGMSKILPGGFGDVMTLAVRCTETAHLPFYISLPEPPTEDCLEDEQEFDMRKPENTIQLYDPFEEEMVAVDLQDLAPKKRKKKSDENKPSKKAAVSSV